MEAVHYLKSQFRTGKIFHFFLIEAFPTVKNHDASECKSLSREVNFYICLKTCVFLDKLLHFTLEKT